MIKSNKPRNSREGERERDVAPTKPSRAPKAVAPPPHAAVAAGTHRHGPDTRHPAPVLGTRYPAPAHAAAPLRPRGPALAALPTEKLRLSPLFFFPLSFSFLPFFPLLFFFFGTGEESRALRSAKAAQSGALSPRPGPPPAPQRNAAESQRRGGTAPLRTASPLGPRRCGAPRGTQPGQRWVQTRNRFPGSVRYKGPAVLARSSQRCGVVPPDLRATPICAPSRNKTKGISIIRTNYGGIVHFCFM